MNGRLLSLCLLAYPRARRVRDGEVLRDLATELSARRGAIREAFGLIRGGLAARWEDAACGARAPWGDGLRRLALPLAAANAAVWVVGALRWGTFDLGKFWTVLAAGSLIALAGAVARSRVPALLGALMVLGALLLDGVRSGLSDAYHVSPFDASLGYLPIDLFGAWIPAAALLAAAALALPVGGERRARTLASRAALGALPALALILLYRHRPLGTPDTVLVLSLGALPPLAAIGGTLGARRNPVAAVAAALALAAWTPEAVWLGTGYLPIEPASLPLPLALALVLALWSFGGLIAGLAVLGLAKRAAHQPPPAPS
ncbi:MAG: hypothetical protein ACR2ML_02755 [Solirubrobacteraceae bacterium]